LFSIAVNDRKKVNNEWIDGTLWIKVQIWGRLGETASQYLVKGRPVLVAGRIGVEEWKDNEGKPRFNLTLTATEMSFIGEKPQGQAAPPQNRPPASRGPSAPSFEPEITDDDIPF
jgi:single-strand DNA-binding protein